VRRIIIAIDGYGATGKSTTARGVAAKLDYLHIDSGAMYRALAWYLLGNGLREAQSEQIEAVLDQFSLHVEREGSEMSLYVGGERLEEALRTPEVTGLASVISAFPAVREKLITEQRRLGREGGIVMDGRDIGMVVFPQAELKVFMTAALEIRAQRRCQELRRYGHEVSLEAVKQEIVERDRRDETRAISPLRQAPDAKVLDTTSLTIPEQIEIVVRWAEARIYASLPS